MHVFIRKGQVTVNTYTGTVEHKNQMQKTWYRSQSQRFYQNVTSQLVIAYLSSYGLIFLLIHT